MPDPSSAPPTAGGDQSEAVLGCVAVPIMAGDIRRNLPELFALWADERFLPVLDGNTRRPHLMIVINRASPDQLARIEAQFHAHSRLATAFSGLSARSAELEGERDLYVREGSTGTGVFGRKSGPNFLFQRLIELATPHGGFVLQIELDCLPVQAGWIDATQGVIADHARAWVIGSLYAGSGMVGDDNKSHLNGNALYRVGDSAFRAFFSEVWMPRLMHQIAERPDLAYDCWWAVEWFRADARTGNDSWRLFQTYDGFFANDPFVVNLLASQQGAQGYAQVFDRFAGLGRVPVFFHGPDMHTVRQMLLRHPGDSIFDAIDRIDPPEGSRRPRPPMRRAPSDVAVVQDVWATRLAARATSGALSAEQVLLQIAAALLTRDIGDARSWPDRGSALGQAVAAARASLGEAHPACAHFDTVKAYASDRASRLGARGT